MTAIQYICLVFVFYLIGSFPTGYLIARAHGVDITKTGSGSVGATNLGRTVGKKAGLLTLLGDIVKGWLGVFLAQSLSTDLRLAAVAGLMLVVGHCFSIPGILKGGKGIATALGVMLGLTPLTGIFSLLVFILAFAAKKTVSLASIAAAFSVPLLSCFFQDCAPVVLAMLMISLTVIVRHLDNIQRMIAGTEQKYSFKK